MYLGWGKGSVTSHTTTTLWDNDEGNNSNENPIFRIIRSYLSKKGFVQSEKVDKAIDPQNWPRINQDFTYPIKGLASFNDILDTIDFLNFRAVVGDSRDFFDVYLLYFKAIKRGEERRGELRKRSLEVN